MPFKPYPISWLVSWHKTDRLSSKKSRNNYIQGFIQKIRGAEAPLFGTKPLFSLPNYGGE